MLIKSTIIEYSRIQRQTFSVQHPILHEPKSPKTNIHSLLGFICEIKNKYAKCLES